MLKPNRDNGLIGFHARRSAAGSIGVCAVAELRLVGGEATLEGHELAAAAAAAGLSVRWLDFANSEAQAAIAAQGPGAVRLPLVIVGTTTLQRPAFTDVSACLAASELRTHLLTCERLRQLGPPRCGLPEQDQRAHGCGPRSGD